MTYYLAVDIGASSGRLILSHIQNKKIVLEEIYRFDNTLMNTDGHLCWNLNKIYTEIICGLKRCKELGKIPSSMGIDTWAVDFVLLDKKEQVLGNTIAYRDSRTEGMDKVVEEKIAPSLLYARTGIQKQPFNTIYQLMAVKQEHPDNLFQAESLLMIPEYLNFLLTGIKMNEYTNATSTGLVNALSKTWDTELINTLGLPSRLFKPLFMPKSVVGGFINEVKDIVGFDCTVVLPATHDTGSAFIAVPAGDDEGVYISSGTWSLLGVENAQPITTEESRMLNFTNEGGYQYRYRYLKNIMGLWMIQSIRRNLGKAYSFAQLEAMAKEAKDFTSIVDVNNVSFLAPENMIDAVKNYCKKTGQPVPETIGQVMQCVYLSLARCYAQVVNQLQSITGKSYTRIHIVGGGSRDEYLNTLTAQETGLPVYAGPMEATAIGNLMAQMIESGEFADIQAAREAVRTSFDIKIIQPK